MKTLEGRKLIATKLLRRALGDEGYRELLADLLEVEARKIPPVSQEDLAIAERTASGDGVRGSGKGGSSVNAHAVSRVFRRYMAESPRSRASFLSWVRRLMAHSSNQEKQRGKTKR